MKRTFRRYLFLTTLLAIIAVLVFNFYMQGRTLRKEMVLDFKSRLAQITTILEDNEKELEKARTDAENSYRWKARNFAYMISNNPGLLEDRNELEHVREILEADELCVTDENGIIIHSTEEGYLGMDFHDYAQARVFVDILDDPSLEIVQEIRENAANKGQYKYAAVARTDKKGIVQIGMKSERVMKAEKYTAYPYVFSRIPMSEDENMFAVDVKNGEILGYTREGTVGTRLWEKPSARQELLACRDGGFLTLYGERRFVVTRQENGIILGITIKEDALYAPRIREMLLTSSYLIAMFLILAFVLDYLLDRKIVRRVERIVSQMKEITGGNLDLVLEEEGPPEIMELSRGINKMVDSSLRATVKISNILNIVNLPVGVFECNKENNQVLATDKLKEILLLTEDEEKRLLSSRELFLKRIEELMENREAGQDDIFRVGTVRWVRIKMVCDGDEIVGTVSDVSREMREKKKIRYERDHDALTGLKNYFCFSRRVKEILEQEENSGEWVAAVMMDLDNFKAINDTYGHDCGDDYLKKTAEVMREVEDDRCLVGRRSGDEFCMFLYGLKSPEEADEYLERLQTMMERKKIRFSDGQTRTLEISMGAAKQSRQKGLSFQELFHEADEELYRIKKEKKKSMDEGVEKV